MQAWRLSSFAAAVAACAFAVPALAADAAGLYADGRFAEAGAAAGGAHGADADEFALAAKAYTAAAVFADDDMSAQAEAAAARRFGEAAVAADPDHVEGRLFLSTALWLQGRERGGFDAYKRGMPQRGRALIESVVADHPDEPWAHALLGAWHFEVLRRGGRFGARLLDADIYVGAAEFNRAMELDPDNPAIAAQCALAYLAVDPEAYAEHARIAIARALAVRPRDAFEARMQERARDALALMDAGDADALAAAVSYWVDGPGYAVSNAPG